MREWTIIRKLLPLLQLQRWGFPAIVVLGLLQSLSEGIGIGLFIPLLNLVVGRPPQAQGRMVSALDTLFRRAPADRRLAVIVVCLFVAVLTSAVLAYAHGIVFAWLDGRIGDQLRGRLFRQLLRVPFGFIERDRSGHLLNVLGTDTWRTSEALKNLVRLTVDASTIAVYVGLLLLLSWRLTVLVAGALLCISLGIRALTRGVRESGERATRANSELGDLMVEGIEGMRVIRAFGREPDEQRRFELCSARVRSAFFRMHLLEEAVHPVHDLLAGVLLLSILFATARSGSDVSTLLVFAFVLYRLQPRVKDADAARVRLVALSPSVEEVVSLLDATARQPLVSGTVVQPAPQRAIAFERVTFRYDNTDEPALADASFRIPANKTTALVGLSGGGKSTVIKLILRFDDPTAGAILVDGRPLPELDLAAWRSQLALVSQDVYLFNASVRENIAYGRLEASLEEVIEAARKADAHGFIQRLPHGYDTVLGPRGVRLSGGQQQRISLARAIVRDPGALILDEATNALDSISEHWIQQTLDELRERRTVIMIAHRLSTIERADQIIVLGQGRVLEQGTPSELIPAGGLFSQLYELQHRAAPVHHA